jgi:hypothetical protein
LSDAATAGGTLQVRIMLLIAHFPRTRDGHRAGTWSRCGRLVSTDALTRLPKLCFKGILEKKRRFRLFFT